MAVTPAETLASEAQAAKDFIGVTQLQQRDALDGRGTKIAIIDSGVDVSHPYLQLTKYGQAKVSEWIDLTSDGQVKLVPVKIGTSGVVEIEGGGTLTLGRIASRSGEILVGAFKEPDRDLNSDGHRDTLYWVVATDSRQAGVYDSFYIDTNANANLIDERAMSLFALRGDTQSFRTAGGKTGTGFVLARFDAAEKALFIGFDALGHGTGVAGLAAGHGASAPLSGVAPGAQVIAVKVITADGATSWESLLQGVRAAVAAGADVINISIGMLDPGSIGQRQAELDQALAGSAAMVVAAVGNQGPYLATVNSPADLDGVLAVGGFVLRYRDNGEPYALIQSLSSRGPSARSTLKPDILGPGAAQMPAPVQFGQPLFKSAAGSSVAAPYVAGSAALLKDYAKQNGRGWSGAVMLNALRQGAVAMEGVARLDQGSGMVEVAGALQHLLAGTASRVVKASAVQFRVGETGSFLQRTERLGEVEVMVTNPSLQPMFIELGTTDVKAVTDRRRLIVGAGSSATFKVRLYPDWTDPLLLAGISGSQALPGGRSGDLLFQKELVELNPRVFDSDGTLRLSGDFSDLPTGLILVAVPAGAAELVLSLGANMTGVAVGVMSPSLKKLEMASGELRLKEPESGIWQVLVRRKVGATNNNYDVRLRLQGVTSEATDQERRNFRVVARQVRGDIGTGHVYAALDVRDASTNRAVDGVVTYAGRDYKLLAGKCFLPVRKGESVLTLEVRTRGEVGRRVQVVLHN
jgi:subtilisin family serine protease